MLTTRIDRCHPDLAAPAPRRLGVRPFAAIRGAPLPLLHVNRVHASAAAPYDHAMAQQKIVTLIDDLDGTEAAETVTFAIDGGTYEIDLSEKNATALREALRRYVTAARKAGTQGSGRTRVTIPSAGHSRHAEIRAWAHSNGHHVPARGRIPQQVVAAFAARL